MKIRGKLIISFLIIAIFPLCAGLVCFHLIVQNQTDILSSYYSTQTENNYDYGLVLNPVQLLYKLTLNDYNKLVKIADETPDKLLDKNFLDDTSRSISSKDSFIVVFKGKKEYYIGNMDFYDCISTLPSFSEYSQGKNDNILIDPKSSTLTRSKDFYFSDGTSGQLFLITKLSNLIPRWESSVKDIAIAFTLILFTTACILLLWLYHSIIKPLNILRIATMQIGEGNLDNPVHVNSCDEIGILCRDFEEMRIRLKSMLEERIQYENDTREMMSNISHDLKTPLTAIKGYSEGLIDGIAKTPEKQQKYLKTIYSKVNDMTYLVDELSLFSKIEQNSIPYNFITFDIAEYLENYIDSISFDYEANNMNVSYENTAPEGILVSADPEQLRRVLNNITGNALKYKDKEHGNIRIALSYKPHKHKKPLYRQINKDGTDVNPPVKPEEFVRIEISDDGPGISEKDLPNIFDRFFRADASRNSAKRGSGLGLAIVKKIILDHGGNIWAKSTPGTGTSIYFTLKVKDDTR